MEASAATPPPKRSIAEWLFQLTTITIGVLIALSFDAVLQWNGNRTLVNEARETIALEIAANRRTLDAHLATFADRIAKVDQTLRLIRELEAGTEPTIREVNLTSEFPSLGDAGWQTAERTGALALMDYSEVQELARLYTVQALVADNVGASLLATNAAGSVLFAVDDPFTMPPGMRDDFRRRVLELRARLKHDDDLGRILSAAYANAAFAAVADNK
jgi:hypothetical protein